MSDPPGNGNVTKAQMLEYVEEYVGKRFDALQAEMLRGFAEIKDTFAEFRVNYVTKDVFAATFNRSEDDRQKLWGAVHTLEHTTVPVSVHEVECAKVGTLMDEVESLKKLVYKAAGAAGVVAAVASVLADRFFFPR